MCKHILIVDDSSSIRSVVGIALKKAGYKVTEACDGQDALSKATGEKYNLVISDVNMPNMDGLTFVREMKKLPEFKYTPVCMLTTESEQTKMQEGKDAGAKAWIIKPFQPTKLLDVVSKLIGE